MNRFYFPQGHIQQVHFPNSNSIFFFFQFFFRGKSFNFKLILHFSLRFLSIWPCFAYCYFETYWIFSGLLMCRLWGQYYLASFFSTLLFALLFYIIYYLLYCFTLFTDINVIDRQKKKKKTHSNPRSNVSQKKKKTTFNFFCLFFFKPLLIL